jgi:nucleolar GTP-binding protein
MKLAMEMKAEAMKIIAQAGDANEEGVLLTMSTLTDDGVTAVKNAACEKSSGPLLGLIVMSH